MYMWNLVITVTAFVSNAVSDILNLTDVENRDKVFYVKESDEAATDTITEYLNAPKVCIRNIHQYNTNR